MPSDGRKKRGSMLLVDEYFDAEDPRFLEALREVSDAGKLVGLAERWNRDPRPWARRQLLEYLELPLSCPGHQPLVKRTFKHAEAREDDELMAAFLVAFDRLVRRVRKKRWQYDWQTRDYWQEETLRTPRNNLPGGRKPWRVRDGDRLFSYRTRYYLRRRAWRYFRRLGFSRPDDYIPAVVRALKRYRDEDLAVGENILDSWGLLQICFTEHDALEFRTSTVELEPGRSLGELSPAPYFPDVWEAETAVGPLLELLATAPARLVRVWAMQLLREQHAEHLANMDPAQLLALLDHADDEVQQFAAELLSSSQKLASLPIATWLSLLETRNPTALATICEVMGRHVTGERLTLAQCVELACARATPVARMGLGFLTERTIQAADDHDVIAGAAAAQCAAVAPELTAWALGIVGAPGVYNRDAVTRFFDSLLPETRDAAWKWLEEDSPGYDDAVLWSRLLETPFDDLRLRLVEALSRRAALPGTAADDLTPLWTAVLLGVHRGGRQKQHAVAQLGRTLAERPDRAEQLLSVLAVAVRSVRGPERRAGLAAVVTAVEQCPELAPAVAAALPELDLQPAEAAP